MVVIIIFIYFYLYLPLLRHESLHLLIAGRPETKGRSLAEIDEMYNINLPMQKWRCKISFFPGYVEVVANSTSLRMSKHQHCQDFGIRERGGKL